MNSTKLRWELLVGAFLVNLRLFGDQRGEEQELQPTSTPTQPLLLPASPLLPPNPLGSCQGHVGQAYSK